MDAKTKIYSDLNTHDHNFPVLLVNNELVKEDKIVHFQSLTQTYHQAKS